MSFKGRNKKSNLMDPKTGYDMYASVYDEDLLYLNAMEKDAVFKILGDVKGKKILDVGCGTGRVIKYLKDQGAEVTALDISEKMVEICENKFPDVDCVVGDVAELPFEEGEFDIVLGLFLIVHLRDLREAFDEVYRVLKEGGRFILTNINQRKAPKLKTKEGEEIVIDSTYHIPRKVFLALEDSFFKVVRDEMVYDKEVWINEVFEARK